MKQFLVVLFAALIVAGCAEKKADVAQITKANEMIAAGDFEKGVSLLDEMAKTSPKDEALKVARVNGHFKYANYYMFNDSLTPKQKYPNALKQYRVVLSIDSTHKDAKQGADMIVSIYASMGREVPKTE